MNKYEISVWEDYPAITTYVNSSGQTKTRSFLNERKLVTIGSDDMSIQARALSPNLVQDVNGTNTFTFELMLSYIDNLTGEVVSNPYVPYLFNERKIKVKWNNKWYDLVIKKVNEDSEKKKITYTCTDLFINELSKNGYSLEFDTKLENNIGTVGELATKILEGSSWQYSADRSDAIIQKTEGPVYEITAAAAFYATKQSPSGDVANQTIPQGAKILVFYDSISGLITQDSASGVEIQFLYTPNEYVTDINNTLVINGDCYTTTLSSWVREGNTNTFKAIRNNVHIFSISLDAGVSGQYTAERLVRSQQTVYEPLLDRYVSLYKDTNNQTVRGLTATEYTNPLQVINLIANSSGFTSTAGWISNSVKGFELVPSLTNASSIENYNGVSKLRIEGNTIVYNTGIQSNISYFTPNETEISRGAIGGIQKGEKFIFRIKYDFSGTDPQPKMNVLKYNPSTFSYISQTEVFTIGSKVVNDGWNEYTLTAKTSISVNELNEYGIFIYVSSNNVWYRIEDVEFFRYLEGTVSYAEGAEIKRINPGEVSLQSLANTVYKYYLPDSNITDAKDLKYLYVGSTPSSDYSPVYNNYEKICTLTGKQSNRFALLQDLAQLFKAWVRFEILHDETSGAVQFVNGIPQKFVYFTAELGEDTGLVFEYGLDLKGIKRSVDSNTLATKVLVEANTNQYATNGFCTIARSPSNYTRENFIINLDYFVQQNLLNKVELNRDLYSTNSNYIGYYYYLKKYNTEYDNIVTSLTEKSVELIRLNTQKKTYLEFISAATQEVSQLETELISLAQASNANIKTWEQALPFLNANKEQIAISSKIEARRLAKNRITEYQQSLEGLNNSLTVLNNYIESRKTRQQQLIELINEKHKQFNNKYGNFLLEGTWKDDNYIDDTRYYLDALSVAYTSSRPSLSYTISVVRLSFLEDFSSKVFKLGDICYIIDRTFFGFLGDGITPYKEKILINKISYFFDEPEKDVITVQNYKTQFDDLFQRIAATTQSLSYAEGEFKRAAEAVTDERALSFDLLQATFDQNQNLVLSSSNQDVSWDDTGITVIDKFDSAKKTKIMSAGIFITNDGGTTWQNAVNGNGISANVITAGRIDTTQITIFDGSSPSFRWDRDGLTAYDMAGGNNFNKFVRHDKYGIYGYNGSDAFVPTSENDIWEKENIKFGLTWKGFFLRGQGASGSINITSDSTGASFRISSGNDTKSITMSTEDGIIFKDARVDVITIAKLSDELGYGMRVRNSTGNIIFEASKNGLSLTGNINAASGTIGGWTINSTSLTKGEMGLYSAPVSSSIGGVSGNYYLKAFDKFGIKSDGTIVAAGGNIGGWKITSNGLFNAGDAAGMFLRGVTQGSYGSEINYLGFTSTGTFIYIQQRLQPNGDASSPKLMERYLMYAMGASKDNVSSLKSAATNWMYQANETTSIVNRFVQHSWSASDSDHEPFTSYMSNMTLL